MCWINGEEIWCLYIGDSFFVVPFYPSPKRSNLDGNKKGFLGCPWFLISTYFYDVSDYYMLLNIKRTKNWIPNPFTPTYCCWNIAIADQKRVTNQMDELLNLVPLKGNKFNHKKEKERREGEWPEDIINTSAQTVAIAIFHRVQLTRQFNPTLQFNTFFVSKQTATPSLLHFTTFHLLFQTTLYFSNHLHKFAHSLDTPGDSLVRYVL